MTNIRDILIAAREDVDAADIPTELREIAFQEALKLHAAGAGAASPANETPKGQALAPSGPGPGATDGTPLARIAAALGVEEDVVGEVFNPTVDGIELIAPPGGLAGKSAAATKEIALLVAAGRQGAGLEEWTPLSEVREWCDQYRKLDSPNFSSTVKEMESLLRFRGSSRKREVRMSKPAWEEAAALVRRLGGGE
jgi:hypothetical protein